MSLHRSCIEDVLDVIQEIQRMSSLGEMEEPSTLRKKSIRTVADRELRHRFSNRDSANKSIHDACSRRLNLSIGEFDRAVEEWLSGNPEHLNTILLPQAENKRQRNEIESLLKVDWLPITPIAADIREPIETRRIKEETYRILRDTALSRRIKTINDFKCQICDLALKIGKDKPYAEAHHIKPLGVPHNGPDEGGNIICVCPNCHVLLDYGGIELNPEELNSTSEHNISTEYINYHNENIFNKIE